MTSPAAAPRPAPAARLSGPGELVAALPVLLGFVPQESLVLICLEGRRVALVVRSDLPPPEAEDLLVEDLQRRLVLAGTERACVVLLTEQPGLDPRPSLVRLLDDLPVDLLDVLLVRNGRWRSCLCTDDACCPPEGLPLPEQAPAVTLVRAEAALQGRAVLPDRQALVSGLQPPAPSAESLAGLRAAERALAAEVVEHGRTACRERLLDVARQGLRSGEGTYELAVALHDVLVRDEVLTWSLRREERLFGLLLHLARTTPAPYDAPACACLAWVAYQRGEGAVAQVALDRALATDPQYGLALLLQQTLDRHVRPQELRSVSARAAGALRRSER